MYIIEKVYRYQRWRTLKKKWRSTRLKIFNYYNNVLTSWQNVNKCSFKELFIFNAVVSYLRLLRRNRSPQFVSTDTLSTQILYDHFWQFRMSTHPIQLFSKYSYYFSNPQIQGSQTYHIAAIKCSFKTTDYLMELATISSSLHETTSERMEIILIRNR